MFVAEYNTLSSLAFYRCHRGFDHACSGVVNWLQINPMPCRLCLCLIVLGLLLAPGGLTLASPLRLSFVEALRQAGDKAVDPKVAAEKLAQAVARLRQAKSALLPQIEVAAGEVRQTRNLEAQGIKIPQTDPLVGPFNTSDARVALTQRLFDAVAWAKVRTDAAAVERATLSLQVSKDRSMAMVGSLYIEAQRAAQRIVVARSMLDRDQAAASLASAGYAAGIETKLAVDRARAVELASRRRLLEQRAAGKARNRELAVALGYPASQQFILPILVSPPRWRVPEPQELLADLAQHPEVAVAKSRLKQSQLGIRAVKASLFPTFTVATDYGLSGDKFFSGRSTYSYGFSINLPLFQGGLRLGQLAEANSQQRSAQIQLDDRGRTLEASARRAIDMLSSVQAARKEAKANKLAALRGVKVQRAKLVAGLGSQYDLLAARAALSIATDELNEAVAAERMAYLNLYYSLGKISNLARGVQNDARQK